MLPATKVKMSSSEKKKNVCVISSMKSVTRRASLLALAKSIYYNIGTVVWNHFFNIKVVISPGHSSRMYCKSSMK